MSLVLLMLGFCAGTVFTAILVVVIARSRMIMVATGTMSFDETVEAIETSIRESSGWVLSDSKRLNDSMEKNGVEFKPCVQLLKLREPNHAKSVLTDNRHFSCVIPCCFSIYEKDDGTVKISRMNTRLMGGIFGGAIKKVMGGEVSSAEDAMLDGIPK